MDHPCIGPLCRCRVFPLDEDDVANAVASALTADRARIAAAIREEHDRILDAATLDHLLRVVEGG